MSEQDKEQPEKAAARPSRPGDKGDDVRPGVPDRPVPAGLGTPDDDGISADDVDVELPGDKVDLPEPHLGDARISEDVAKTTSLDQVEAEADEVAHEAESAGTLVGGREGIRVTPQKGRTVRPGGAKAAGAEPVTEKTPSVPPAPAVPIAPKTGAAGQTSWIPPRPAFGTPTAANEPAVRGRRADTARGRGNAAGRNSLPLLAGAGVVALILIGLLIWLIVSLLSGGQPSAAPSNAPQDWKQGDCLKGFTDAGHPADVVPCATSHSAQLVGTYFYPADTAYPGGDALKAKAQDVCTGVKLDAAAEKYHLKQFTAYPSQTTWNNKDRRVDCIISDTDGDKITESLIQ